MSLLSIENGLREAFSMERQGNAPTPDAKIIFSDKSTCGGTAQPSGAPAYLYAMVPPEKAPSPRTVTRYRMRESVQGNLGVLHEPRIDVVPYSEVAPLLTALAEIESRSQKHADAAASYSRMLKDQEADNETLRAKLAQLHREFDEATRDF